MQQFTDAKDRTWNIVVDVESIRRVRDHLKVNLLEVVGGDLMERLGNDPVLLCDVIYVLCRPQAEAQKVSDEDFGRGFGGETIEKAAEALMEEIANFFPSRKKAALKTLIGKSLTLSGKMLDLAETKIANLDVDKLAQQLANSKTPSGNLPESSASTPDP